MNGIVDNRAAAAEDNRTAAVHISSCPVYIVCVCGVVWCGVVWCGVWGLL